MSCFIDRPDIIVSICKNSLNNISGKQKKEKGRRKKKSNSQTDLQISGVTQYYPTFADAVLATLHDIVIDSSPINDIANHLLKCLYFDENSLSYVYPSHIESNNMSHIINNNTHISKEFFVEKGIVFRKN